MSDFLLTLARRSVGLTATASSRLRPAESPTFGDDNIAAAAAADIHSPPVSVREGSASFQPLGAPISVEAPARTIVMPMVSTASPVVQRQPLASATAVTVAPPASTSASTSRRYGPDLHTRVPAAPGPSPEAIEAAGPLTVPGPLEGLSPTDPPAAATLVERSVNTRVDHETTRVVELLPCEAAIAPYPEAAAIGSGLTPASSPRPSQPAERTVHVRIGTIEIHATDSQAPAAPAPPPVAAVPVSAPGFDDFTRLRSYAPWAW